MAQMYVKELFERYKETREFTSLSVNSKKSYIGNMKMAQEDYFLVNDRVSRITEKYVDDLYQHICKSESVSKANQFMRIMRRIWSVCKRKGFIKTNPFREMGLTGVPPREIVWDKEQVQAAIDASIREKSYSLSAVIALCYYLAQRPGDMMALNRENFNGDFTLVKFRQRKTGKQMLLPVIPELAKYVKAAIGANGHVVCKFSERQINEDFRALKERINLPEHLQIRDLRRTALVEMMENGATDAEGQSWSGHADRDMLNTYAPSSLAMAQNALNKRFKDKKE
jgi:integrase